jgi:transposase-like protein
MEANGKRKRKKHSEEFKREAVRLLENRGERAVSDVAASLGVAENLLHAWKQRVPASLRAPGRFALACGPTQPRRQPASEALRRSPR